MNVKLAIDYLTAETRKLNEAAANKHCCGIEQEIIIAKLDTLEIVIEALKKAESSEKVS